MDKNTIQKSFQELSALILDGVFPYRPFRSNLYTWQELMEGYSPEKDESRDLKIYEHFKKSRFNPPLGEALAQRIHDHGIDTALKSLLEFNEAGMTNRKCVGIMGGHSTKRTDPNYHQTAHIAKGLTETGYFIASGGGPGIMEAANLGAYFAGKTKEDLNEAIQILSQAPGYKDDGYITLAKQVLAEYPDGKQSLAIPTWFYGHEPSNLFASHIAKYFSNSLREDILLAVSLYGIIFAPGSAGTTQEIFMDAAQNHYATFGYYSPMVFLDSKRYEIQTLIYPLLKQLSWGRDYHELLFISNSEAEIINYIVNHPPVKA